MYQRSNSSAKEVHRGRQQKRISRLRLRSSSSSRTGATVAAVAAAGAEAAWRGLVRVCELCWQTTDRGLQRRATTFEGMEEALSSGENPRPGGIGQSEARRCVLVAMGLAFDGDNTSGEYTVRFTPLTAMIETGLRRQVKNSSGWGKRTRCGSAGFLPISRTCLMR